MNELEALRKKIDEIDDKILDLLSKRMHLSEEIGKRKMELGIPVTDEERERKVHERIKNNAEKIGLEPNDIEKIFRDMIELSKTKQERLKK